jgi:hypothetical protein
MLLLQLQALLLITAHLLPEMTPLAAVTTTASTQNTQCMCCPAATTAVGDFG